MLEFLRGVARDRFSWFFLLILCCIFIWDHHGKLNWLTAYDPEWRGIGNAHQEAEGAFPGTILWDQELVGFLVGFLVVVVIPACLVKWLLRADLADFGFGWPKKGRRKNLVIQTALIAALTFPGFYLAASFPSVRDYYPYYIGDPASLDFLAYELSSSLFYISVEGVFRGYLLFGLVLWLRELTSANLPERDMRIACMAIILSILPYAVWHLGKAPAELWGTLFWGLAAAASALSTRTIWHLIVLHWLLNVFMDYLILLDR